MTIRKKKPAIRKPTPGGLNKAISVMAWIEDPYGQILMVKQAYGKKLWALPGGKVKRNESLLGALKREILEETGYSVTHAYLIDLFDRPTKGNFVILYRVLLKRHGTRKRNINEISSIAYQNKIPNKSTPSAKYFWKRALTSFEPMSVIKKI